MHEVRCRGCLALLGFSPSPVELKVYCSVECAEDFPIRVNEQRDSLIAAMFEQAGELPLGEWFGMTRQAIHQIVNKRDVRRTENSG